MIQNRRNAAACLIVLLFGFGLFYVGTDAFSAFTVETARVNKLNAERPQFPEVTLLDSKQRSYSFSEFKDKYVFITFIYTSCTTVCVELEKNMAEVYDLLPERYLEEDIIFLSISFDPSNDSPEVLERYRAYFGSDGETWRMATISDQQQLDALLDAFGVIVIPDPYGHFAHNSAFYLVNRQARLEKVMDYTKIEQAANTIIEIIDADAARRG